jgi:hypothetical protein
MSIDDEWAAFSRLMDNPDDPYAFSEDALLPVHDKLDSIFETAGGVCAGDGGRSGGAGAGLPPCPKASDIYISTKTKIAFMDTPVDLNDLFWFVPVVQFVRPVEGVISKQIKVSSATPEAQEGIRRGYEGMVARSEYRGINTSYRVMNHIDTTETTTKRYKHTVKISCGMSNKHVTSFRAKEKGVFFNCFALVMRVLDPDDDTFKEVNIKVFNTGKLQLPGIKKDSVMHIALRKLCGIVETYFERKGEPKAVSYDPALITNELVNSDFNCGFNVRQRALLPILKNRYNIISMFDDCSYPGIQSKFYYNESYSVQDGVCRCAKQCTKKSNRQDPARCIVVSFMVFRTGSVMIVGRCKTDKMLYEIYGFIRDLLERHYSEIQEGASDAKKKQATRSKKRFILVEGADARSTTSLPA